MLQIYPQQAIATIEFDKIKSLLAAHCKTDAGKERVAAIQWQSQRSLIEKNLLQTLDYKHILSSGDSIPNDFTKNIKKELKLLGIPNAALSIEQLIAIWELTLCIRSILNWFEKNKGLFKNLAQLIEKINFEKEIPTILSEVIDLKGFIKDTASKELLQIRTQLAKHRNDLRKVFETIIRKLNKQGYLADISEGFLNGRRTVAIFAEHKRIVKGILHGESDSGKIVFIEPEETIELNNIISSYERAEQRELYKILLETTQAIAPYQIPLQFYFQLIGILDFIRAKALFALDYKGVMPQLSQHPQVQVINAYHPLLYLQNKAQQKTTYPITLSLQKEQRILIISGPNAGGKTVTMKTIGLLQLMLQCGLLVPVDDRSEMGIFQQLMIHIGDTQSIEQELSTYSAHLKDMKYFVDFANGKTLFLIDELGSGSDPNMGGAFAEAFIETLAQRKSIGIVTTHYLNLKVMAGKIKGIVNGGMAFDEEKLEPLYQLIIGKPGSSYTFEIAKRSGLPEAIIERAKQLTDRNHFKLDQLLHQTEVQNHKLSSNNKVLNALIEKNKQLQLQYEALADKEKFKQQKETIKLQNEIKKEELDYLRDMERKFKQIIQEWKRSENKQEVIQSAEQLLFKKKQLQANAAMANKADKRFETVGGIPKLGDLMRNKLNHQIGTLVELKDKKHLIKIGNLPFQVQIDEWVVVRLKEEKNSTKKPTKKTK